MPDVLHSKGFSCEAGWPNRVLWFDDNWARGSGHPSTGMEHGCKIYGCIFCESEEI